MKMKYLFHGLLASILLITACQEPDDLVRSDSENINILSVKGSLISDADKQKIRKEIELQKVKFTKRLETYWKRYGSSKLTTSTYLVD